MVVIRGPLVVMRGPGCYKGTCPHSTGCYWGTLVVAGGLRVVTRGLWLYKGAFVCYKGTFVCYKGTWVAIKGLGCYKGTKMDLLVVIRWHLIQLNFLSVKGSYLANYNS